MATYKVAELTGALLDAAVAECGEWKTAHEHFPTMTLDPTFSGWFMVKDDLTGNQACLLKPRNGMRQDPQHYSPSTNWAIGGPIIERERITVEHHLSAADGPNLCDDGQAWCAMFDQETTAYGPTPLVASMRCFVASRLGETVELP